MRPDSSIAAPGGPQRVSVVTERRVAGLREATGFGPDRIGALLGLAPSTCYRVLDRLGYLERVRVVEPVVRYEIAEPGGLLHLDTRSSVRIGAGPGHRATGDRTSRHRGIGWEVLHVEIDVATRLVYAELLPDERGRTTARFLVRAGAGSGRTVSQSFASDRQWIRVPQPRVRSGPALAQPAPQPDPSVSAPDQRPSRALDSGRSCPSASTSRSSSRLVSAVMRSSGSSATTTPSARTLGSAVELLVGGSAS